MSLLLAAVALCMAVVFVSEVIVPHLDPPDHKPRRRVH
jgi:hypothetical protein